MVTHFPHSVGYEGDGRLRDGPWCNGGGFGGHYSGLLQKPGAKGKLEPEWCPNCIAIWEDIHKKPWPRICRCDNTMWEGLPAAAEGCWIHGTPEGLEWMAKQKAMRITLLREQARKCALALEEAERRLIEEAGDDPAVALGA